MPSPDCPVAIRGPQGWISTARSSSSAAKTTAFIGSITSDLQSGHKTYHCVAFQSLNTTPLETSSSNHPRATKRWSKFLQNHPRAINIAPILSPPPLSKSSFSNLHSRKRIGLIGHLTRPHALLEFHYNVNYAPQALHAPLAAHWHHLLTSSTTSALVARLLMSPTDIIIQLVPSQLAYVSLCWPLTVDLTGRWPLTLTQSWLFTVQVLIT